MRFGKSLLLLGLTLVAGLGEHAAAADADAWNRFRGPNGSGVAVADGKIPSQWSSTKNVAWKTPLPGPGSSSPIIVGDRIFVTCWSGYGVDRSQEGEMSDLRRHLVCVDRNSGAIRWQSTVEPVLPEDRYGGMFAEHGYASHTPVSDGQHVFAYFGKSGAVAYDLEGKQLWKTVVGEGLDQRGWGSASSPILFKDLLIVTATAESQAIVALDKMTGKEVWRQEAGGLGSCWGTPILVPVDAERTDLVIGVPYEIWGLAPETGKLRWYCQSVDSDSFCSSVVADGQMVYAIEGRSGGSIAVRAGGKGDVTNSHVVWTGRDNNRIGTPIVHANRIYFFGGRVANCLDAGTGQRIFQERLPAVASSTSEGGFRGGRGGRGGSNDYASPILADGKIFYPARGGEVYVLKANDQFESLGVNRVTEEREDFSATPAVSGGQLFLRSDKHLYCVAASEE